MATFAITLDNGQCIVFEGNLNGDIAGGFSGWTQDGTTQAVTVTLTDPDVVPLAFKPPSGATADETDQLEVYDDTGATIVFLVDAAGNLQARALTGSSIELKASDASDVVRVNGDGTAGFFGATPVAQQEVTGALSSVLDTNAQAVLASIIAALVALGLATDGTT